MKPLSSLLLPPLLATVMACPTARAAEDGVRLEITTRTGQIMTTQTLLVAAGRIRIGGLNTPPDTEEGKVGSETLFAGDRGEVLFIDHDRESVVVFDREGIEQLVGQVADVMAELEAAMAAVPEDQRAVMEEMMKDGLGVLSDSEPPPPRDLIERGRAEFGGRACQMYELRRGDERSDELCTVPFDSLEGGSIVAEAVEQIVAFYGELVEALAEAPMMAALLEQIEEESPLFFMELPGFPVMSRHYEGDEVQSERVLSSIESLHVEMDELEAPANYERQSFDVDAQ